MENLQNLKITKNDLGLIPSPQKLDLTEGFFTGNLSDVKKTLKSSDKELSPMEKEAYTLEITPSSIEITAKDEAGLFYGEMTVKQLFTVPTYSPLPATRSASSSQAAHLHVLAVHTRPL